MTGRLIHGYSEFGGGWQDRESYNIKIYMYIFNQKKYTFISNSYSLFAFIVGSHTFLNIAYEIK